MALVAYVDVDVLAQRRAGLVYRAARASSGDFAVGWMDICFHFNVPRRLTAALMPSGHLHGKAGLFKCREKGPPSYQSPLASQATNTTQRLA